MTIKKCEGSTPILGLSGSTVLDFWSWAYSDMLSNVNRGVLAEFLVASALGLTDNPRLEWDAVDLHYGDHTIEVKASAYCQSWSQTRPSQIIFDIAPKRSWYAETNTYDSESKRSADCYVFCLFAEEDSDLARNRVLDIEAWRFYVLSRVHLDERFGKQKTLGLSKLEAAARGIQYADLKKGVDRVLSGNA